MEKSSAIEDKIRQMLHFLTKIDEVEIKLVGADREKATYFKVVDSATSQRLLVMVATSPTDDVSVLDKHEKTRFMIHGAFSIEGQLDVYISNDVPVGIVKQNVIYSHQLIPLYHINRNVSICGADSSYTVENISSKLPVALVTFEDLLVYVEFLSCIENATKALIISASFHYGVTKHQMFDQDKKLVDRLDIFLKTSKPTERSQTNRQSISEQRKSLAEEIAVKSEALAREATERSVQLSKQLHEEKRATVVEIKRNSVTLPSELVEQLSYKVKSNGGANDDGRTDELSARPKVSQALSR